MAASSRPASAEPLRPGLLEWDVHGNVTLLGNRCDGCGTTYFPAHGLCVRCLSAERLRSARLSRQGTVYTFTVVYQSTPEFPTPYVLAYVDLPEGVRVLAQMTDVVPRQVQTGMAVEVVGAVVPSAHAEEPPLMTYRFRPAGERADGR